jgi:hypothetical protein
MQTLIERIYGLHLCPPPDELRLTISRHLSIPNIFWDAEHNPRPWLSPMFVVRFALGMGFVTEEKDGAMIDAWREAGLSGDVDKGLAARISILSDDGEWAKRHFYTVVAMGRMNRQLESRDLLGYHQRVAEAENATAQAEARLQALGIIYPEVGALIAAMEQGRAVMDRIGLL